jgi:hypothetical protein
MLNAIMGIKPSHIIHLEGAQHLGHAIPQVVGAGVISGVDSTNGSIVGGVAAPNLRAGPGNQHHHAAHVAEAAIHSKSYLSDVLGSVSDIAGWAGDIFGGAKGQALGASVGAS